MGALFDDLALEHAGRDGHSSPQAHALAVVRDWMRTATEAQADALRMFVAAGGDPLAALEAAERRLLEAGGWTAVPDPDYRGYWRDRDGRMCKQAVAILQERRRLAAKGGV